VRVAFIGTRGVPARYSGFETCVEQVGRRMVQRGHEVVVFCRSMHYRERLDTYLGMKLRYLPVVPQKHLETLSHTALSAFRLGKGTAIVCMGVGNAPVVRTLERLGRRTVFNVDGADWQREKWGKFARWYLKTSESQAARGKSIVVADALAVQEYYRREYGRDTELVAYGADPPADSRVDTPYQFGLKPGEYLLWVGRLVPENAPDDFIEGVRLAGLKVPAVVVGDASYADDYIARLRAMATGDIVFTGYQFGSAYQQLTAHAGVFVLAATVGGTHPVLIEQMAAGNAILARDTESNREVLGDAGLFWRTPAEMAELLKALWPNAERRAELGECARRRAADRYSWDQVTTRYLELCERSLTRV
jgi:glycosyltransferase involved in cell wall biosynthesis